MISRHAWPTKPSPKARSPRIRASPERTCRGGQERAEEEAVGLTLATIGSRLRVEDMLVHAVGERSRLYADDYPHALAAAGLAAVDLIDSFPVLTGNFAYTRGESTPGASRLVPFRSTRGRYAVYADIAETEALLFRLDPIRVARWLEARGFDIGEWHDPRSTARRGARGA